jgi:hypothetical protein
MDITQLAAVDAEWCKNYNLRTVTECLECEIHLRKREGVRNSSFNQGCPNKARCALVRTCRNCYFYLAGHCAIRFIGFGIESKADVKSVCDGWRDI